MGRNMSIVVIDEQGNERAVHRVTYGSRLLSTKATRQARPAIWRSGIRTPARS
jgi:uncharacterized protein GlcG (DUF336 family)